MQSAAAVALIPLLLFAAYTAAVTHNAFQRAGQPQKLCLALGISIGSAVFAGVTNVKYRHTDTQTDHTTPSVAIGRI